MSMASVKALQVCCLSMEYEYKYSPVPDKMKTKTPVSSRWI